MTDHYATDDTHALYLTQHIVRSLNDTDRCVREITEPPEQPVHSPDELYGIVGDDLKKSFDIREVKCCNRFHHNFA